MIRRHSFISLLFFIFFFAAGTMYAGNIQAETLSKEELLEDLNQGNALFLQAIEMGKKDPVKSKDLYSKAIMHFERIVWDGKVRNGKLFYNIGNACFRTGSLGKAILYYKRASELIPNDQNLVRNLEYARSKRTDDIGEKEQVKISRTIFFWHYGLSATIRFAIFIILFFMIWVSVSLMLFVRKSFLKWGVIIPAILAALFLGSLVFDMIEGAMHHPGVILSQEVVARKGDSDAYEKSFEQPLHAGVEFSLIEKRRTWYNIELADGTRCWIPEKDADLVRIE